MDNIKGEALDLNKLEALAKAATPGPWRTGSWTGHCKKPSHAGGRHPGAGGDDPCVYEPVFMDGLQGIAGPEAGVVWSSYDGVEMGDADAAYIAAANPAAILELIALARAGSAAPAIAAPAATAEPNTVTMPQSVWESWQQWGDAWFKVCEALNKAWPSWGLGKEPALDAACNIITQLAKWENERRAAPTTQHVSAAPTAAQKEGTSAQDAKDAERYRFMVRYFGVTTLPCLLERHFQRGYVADGKESIDAAIDAAMSAAQAQPKDTTDTRRDA